MGSRWRSPYVGMTRFQDGGSNQNISVFHGDIIAEEQILEYKITKSSLQSLPQSVVVITMRGSPR